MYHVTIPGTFVEVGVHVVCTCSLHEDVLSMHYIIVG